MSYVPPKQRRQPVFCDSQLIASETPRSPVTAQRKPDSAHSGKKCGRKSPCSTSFSSSSSDDDEGNHGSERDVCPQSHCNQFQTRHPAEAESTGNGAAEVRLAAGNLPPRGIRELNLIGEI
ncbi:hypothetical protein DPEC_G00182360 [Dallia pectoralis]|uniref:Uncharacterized protein n=1 Tax=Dallia pectoralis TaxID=75939 RepID=A0ACC2GAP8_DALPE|nr:hypothetical protein DPEC_G00182360 [Dallia pectoralis]